MNWDFFVPFCLGGLSYYGALQSYQLLSRACRYKFNNVVLHRSINMIGIVNRDIEATAKRLSHDYMESIYDSLTKWSANLDEEGITIQLLKDDAIVTDIEFTVKTRFCRGKLAEMAKKKAEKNYARTNRS